MRKFLALIVSVIFLLAGGNTPAQSNGSTNIPIKTPVFGGIYTVSEDLGVTPVSLQKYNPALDTYEGIYTLKFSVQNLYPKYPGYYDVAISFGSQELCETGGWAGQYVTEVTLACLSPNYIVLNKTCILGQLQCTAPAQGNSDLVVTFSFYDWQLIWSNVSLTYTPRT
jgi:hypothetical protein